MVMSSGLRKLALTAHLTTSIGWLGAVAAFLPLAIAAATSVDDQTVRSAALAMRLVVFHLIVPLAWASLATGLVCSLGTKWGLFRHYWVLIKLVLTVIAILVLMVQLAPIGEIARMAADPSSSAAILRGLSKRPLIHGAAGLVVLLVIQVLGVYKPGGKTKYGRRVLGGEQ